MEILVLIFSCRKKHKELLNVSMFDKLRWTGLALVEWMLFTLFYFFLRWQWWGESGWEWSYVFYVFTSRDEDANTSWGVTHRSRNVWKMSCPFLSDLCRTGKEKHFIFTLHAVLVGVAAIAISVARRMSCLSNRLIVAGRIANGSSSIHRNSESH